MELATDVERHAMLNATQVRRMLGGVSLVCIKRWIADPDLRLPPPDIRIHRRAYWYLGTIRDWQRSQEAKLAA